LLNGANEFFLLQCKNSVTGEGTGHMLHGGGGASRGNIHRGTLSSSLLFSISTPLLFDTYKWRVLR
jgi:hypothetical protein